MTPKTQTERIDAAIEGFERACSKNHVDKFETVLGIPVRDILHALRIHRALLQEPSDGMLSEGAKAWIQDPAHKSSTLFKAMANKLIDEQKDVTDQ